jgi:hypothetical protein
MFCPNCGTFNVETNRFCLKCGQQLPVIPAAPIAAVPNDKALRRTRKWPLLVILVLILAAVLTGAIWLLRGQTANSITLSPTGTPAVTQTASPDAQRSPLTTPVAQTLTAPLAPFDSPQAKPTRLAAGETARTIAGRTHVVYLPAVLQNACFGDVTPYGLASNQLSRLGCPAQAFVTSRRVIIQRFEHGVMVLFAKPSNVFDKQGGGFIYALAADGRAWKLKDIFAETTSDRRRWYDCDTQSNEGPEVTGVPWRGFGKVWCAYPAVQQALGKALSREETGMAASFQSYEMGRAFKVSDWRGFPGWQTSQVIIVYLPTAEGDYIPGRWEIR